MEIKLDAAPGYPILTIDAEAGAAYLALQPNRKGRIASTEELNGARPMMLIDYDAEGKALGIEIISGGKR
jgi:uncharacterized protein YuzE